MVSPDDVLLHECHFTERTNTIDFIGPDGLAVLQTCARERDRIVFQIGTNDAKRALAVGRMM